MQIIVVTMRGSSAKTDFCILPCFNLISQMATAVKVNLKLTRTGAPIRQEGKNKNLKHIPCNNVSSKRSDGTYIWSKHRQCPHLLECWYSHSQQEYESSLYAKPCLEKRPDGTCPRPNCRFNHSIVATPVDQSQKILKPCRYLQPDGTCKFGDSCKYSHDPSIHDSHRSNWDVLCQNPEYIKHNFQPLNITHKFKPAQSFLINLADEDVEMLEEGEIAPSLFDTLFNQVIASFDTQNSAEMQELMNNYDALQHAAEQLANAADTDQERVIDIDLGDLKDEHVQTILNIFQSLTNSQLDINVFEK